MTIICPSQSAVRCPLSRPTRRPCHHLSSTVGDGDEVNDVSGVDVPVPDGDRPFLAFGRQGGFPHLELRLVRQRFDGDARLAPRFVSELGDEVAGDALRVQRRGLALNPALLLRDVSERHYFV